MSISIFDLFKVGIGPSSSHTVGPMKAAREFALALEANNLLTATAGVRAELYGSLGATGCGHGSPKAVVLGLEGDTPEGVVYLGMRQHMLPTPRHVIPVALGTDTHLNVIAQ